ncbi:DUF418 domain-containing protein [Pseudoalteromonas porphyrae]|uniref:DUF418 domain-containing protein n=1 Tax=Pseudoalteromonas porphyrae TaxID=187330 RepID=A0A0N0M101_9GAMM|nr:DUF418 domain-containing protein [Pseudoalteromonas porphyrae]KPH64651.1 hypothetical protein ADS77_05100 [Pseudoalteromonas porphyrae]
MIAIDIARALAIFGMVIVNFKIAMNVQPGNSPLYLFSSLFEGRASALFVILAGIGITFMTLKARQSGLSSEVTKSKWSLIKRAVLLMLIGLAYVPIWEADILHFYGVYFIIAACIFTLSNRVLLLISGFFVLAFPLLLICFDYSYGWDWNTLTYHGFWTVDGMLRHVFFNGFHPVFPWCGFLVFGMWLGRQDLLDSQFRKQLLIGSIAVLLITELLFYGLRLLTKTHAELGIDLELSSFLLSTSIIPPLPQYMLSATSSSVIVLVGCFYFTDTFQTNKLSHWLKQTGQISLTLYVAHVLVGMGVLESLGLLNNQTIGMALFSALLFCLFSIIFSVCWLNKFKAGPLEWVFKKLIR